MDYYPFPALLLADYNSTYEYGRATICPPGSIDFTSDFVPLLPLGTKAAVTWVRGDRTLASFQGRVYLSSPQLLRLVDVDPAALEAAVQIFAINTRLPASCGLHPGNQRANKNQFPVEILYLTNDTIKLRTALNIEIGTTLYLNANVEFLTLQNLALKAVDKVVLRRGETLLLCSLQQTGEENFIAISTYAARLAAQNKD